MITFNKMDKQASKHAFAQWHKENPKEKGQFQEEYHWYLVIKNKQIIGKVGISPTLHILNSKLSSHLEFMYIQPEHRGRGYSTEIRNALLKNNMITAVSIGLYYDDVNKLKKHKLVASKSGFNKHCVLIIVGFNGEANSMGEVFVHESIDENLAYTGMFRAPSLEYARAHGFGQNIKDHELI